ncbi:MAG: hypothetical protein FD175_1295 [Beijerinckiaceae bacterium]|nr:MAG: hypothetical protein FD175_1295 [Beijerinckiaceae bacterium]
MRGHIEPVNPDNGKILRHAHAARMGFPKTTNRKKINSADQGPRLSFGFGQRRATGR